MARYGKSLLISGPLLIKGNPPVDREFPSQGTYNDEFLIFPLRWVRISYVNNNRIVGDSKHHNAHVASR